MLTTRRLGMMGMTLAMLLLTVTSGMAQTRVELNGNPMSFDVAPMQVADRTMVPMRAIFEALGAEVNWNEATQTVTATRDATDVQLTIGEVYAMVNGGTVALDVPAMIHRGSTMVPLRFVSESLGAQVGWSEATRTVSISTGGTEYFAAVGETGNGSWANTRTVFIPQGTVVPVSLNTALSSSTNALGDTFSVTVVSSQEGDAEFPRGTRLDGVIVGVQRAGNGEPGTLDLSFREARLPDGSRTPITGALISLDDESVTRSDDGRLKATVKAKDDRLLMIGIGVGAGLIIGKLLKQNLIVGGLLGGAAGYLYNELTKDKAEPTDVDVKPGTVFGVRMDRDVSYGAPSAFADARSAYLNAQ